jgi:hypothetical protein
MISPIDPKTDGYGNHEEPVESVRKASDVLLSLEEKIIHLTKVMNTYDLNIKIILDRTNRIYSYIEELKREYEIENNQQPAQTANITEIFDIPGGNTLPVAEDPMISKRALRADVVIDAVVPPLPEDPSGVKRISVIQRICDDKGKDLFMADVSVIDQNKSVIQKTKTTANGKWQARLMPGKYMVNIIKTDTASKKKIEAMQEITVGGNSATMTLPVMIVKR